MPVSRTLHAAFIFAIAWNAACSDPQATKRRHVERGDQYLSKNNLDAAAIEYANAVRLDPQFGEARFKLAQTYEQIGNLRAAFAEYVRAADALPDDRKAQIRATEVLLLAGRYDDAKTRASTLLEKNPDDLDALLLRANAMAALKDPAGAIAEIEQAIKLRPDDSRGLISLGTIQMQSGARKEAEAAFREAVATEPTSVDAHLAFANFLWSTERVAEAEQEIKQGLALEPQHMLANRMLGLLYMATDRQAQAEQPLKAIADASKSADAQMQLADYYLATGRKADAKQLLLPLLKGSNPSPDAELKLASIEYSDNAAEGHKRVDHVLSRAQGYPPALVLKAQWLTNENKLDEALKAARAAVEASPDLAAAHFALATILDRRGEDGEAIKEYNEVLRVNPRAAAAQVELSRLNLAAGNRDAALRHAEDAARAAPTNTAARIALVKSLLMRGELGRAETEMATLTKSLPDSAVVHTLQGTLYARRQNVAAARASFERARSLSPQSTEALAGLVALDIQSKQVSAAVARVESELQQQPNNPQVLTLAAQVFNVAGQGQRAEQLLKQAVAADSRFLPAYTMLAAQYVRGQRLDEARAEYEGLAKRDPSAAAPRTMVGVILEAQGKRQEAKQWYESTLAGVSDAPVVANNLAMIYADEGTNLDMALQLATTAKQGLPDNADVDDTLGWVYYKKDLPALAIGPFEDSLRRRPDTPEVLYHLGLAHAKLGNTDKARDAMERALKLNPNFAGSDIARATLTSLKR
jgi:tetratricopeptide (TPR) repeat protein